MLGRENHPIKSIRFLSIVMDNRMTFGNHIKYAINKANKRMMKQARIMPNVGGSSSAKPLVLNGVTNSILLYGSPVRALTLKIKKYNNKLESS